MRRPLVPCGCAIALLLLVGACASDPAAARQAYLESGDRYAASGQLNEAAVEYLNAIQQDPRSGEARFKLAQVFLRNDNFAGALREFLRAADLMPEDVEAQFAAALVQFSARRFEDARTRAARVLALEPGHVEARLLEANALVALQEYAAALAAADAAILAAPDRGLSYANRGAILLMQGRTAEAEAAFVRGVTVDPDSPRSRTELAAFYLATGRAADAESVLAEALRLAPGDAAAHRSLAQVYISSNRAAEAEPHLLAAASASDDRDAHLALADYYRALGRHADALRVLDAMDVGGGEPVAATARRSLILYAAGRTLEAHAAIDAALARGSRSVDAHLVKAELLMAESRFDEALTQARAAVSVDPMSAPAYVAVGRIQRERGEFADALAALTEVLRLSPANVGARLELSALHLAEGRPVDTVHVAQEALAIAPENPVARLLHARGLLRTGEVRSAERSVAAVAREHPGLAIVHVQLGEVYREQDDRAAARAAYGRALALDALNADALAGLATLDALDGRTADARARIEAALGTAPAAPVLLRLAARTYAQLEEFDLAERALARAIALDAGDAEAYELLARVYRVQGRIDDAIVQFDALATRTPRAAGVHVVVGEMLESAGRIEEARARYERALQIDPNSPVAANNLAWLLAEYGGSLDRALQLAQAAWTRLPESPYVADTLGWIYYKRGMFPQAVSLLEDSVEQVPGEPAFRYHLGLSYAKAGDGARARAALQAALTLDPASARADEARRVLAQLDAIGY